ncbi:MAG: hypothetical protein OER86_13475, partial [Phycisphaerae bacterium]|nr:hypothetical protein [Phycisphaerae bacterium]
NNPFQGPNTDNIYAIQGATIQAPGTTFVGTAGDEAANRKDVVLVPVTGAGGGATTLAQNQ